MAECVICQQTQERRLLIEADLRSCLAESVIAVRYRVPKIMVMNHTAHMDPPQPRDSPVVPGVEYLICQQTQERRLLAEMDPPQPSDSAVMPGVATRQESWIEDSRASVVSGNPLSEFKHAWQAAKDDPGLRAHMVTWLNDQLQADDMGLP